MKKIKLLDTFAWVWWFHLALEQSIWKENIECIWYSEIDKFASSVYENHFPWTKNYWDITKIDIENLPELDLLTGGFPCTDVSVAGKWDLTKWRTILVEYLLQILEKKQPKYFVFENVKWLMSKKFDTFRESIFERMRDAWYEVTIEVLNTKDFWLPQNRERVFMVWKLSPHTWIYHFPIWQELTTFLKDILEEEVEEKYYLNEKQIEKIENSNFVQEKRRIQKWNTCETLLARDYKDPKCTKVLYNLFNNRVMKDISWTLWTWSWLTNKQWYMVVGKTNIRKLTPTEYARLQGFPDNWSTDFGFTH